MNDMFEDTSKFPASPFAKFSGELMFGDTPVDCYVLDTEARVVAMRGAVKAITAAEHGNLGEIIGVNGLKPHINAGLALGENTITFTIPGTQFLAKGITSDGFTEICAAYLHALVAGDLKTPRQRQIAGKCGVLLAGFAKVGLTALIDEATGYQQHRVSDALQVKLAAYLSESLRPWEKLFPDQLWEEFGRLTNWQGPLHLRPLWWGKLVNELIYESLDPDIAHHLQEHKPPPRHGRNYHQYFSEDFGVKQLQRHINLVLGMAMACRTMDELRLRVGGKFKGKPLQEYLF